MDAQIEIHLPLITHRITFAPKAFPPPAMITARMEFPAVTISPRDLTPPPTPDPKTATIRKNADGLHLIVSHAMLWNSSADNTRH